MKDLFCPLVLIFLGIGLPTVYCSLILEEILNVYTQPSLFINCNPTLSWLVRKGESSDSGSHKAGTRSLLGGMNSVIVSDHSSSSDILPHH